MPVIIKPVIINHIKKEARLLRVFAHVAEHL